MDNKATSRKRSRNSGVLTPSDSLEALLAKPDTIHALLAGDNEDHLRDSPVESSSDEDDYNRDPDIPDLSDSDSETPGSPCQTPRQRKIASKDDAVLKYGGDTRATPLIRHLAGNLFGQNIALLGGPKYDFGTGPGLDRFTCDPETLRRQFEEAIWYNTTYPSIAQFQGPQTWQELYDGIYGYGAAIIDGQSYRKSDGIIVCPPYESESRLPKRTCISETTQVDPSKIRFARIEYLYQDWSGGKYAHIRYFEHGSHIPLLQELAGPRALFLLTECENIKLKYIVGKIQLEYIGHDDPRTELAESKVSDLNHFFYQFHFDEDSNKITDASFHESISPNGALGKHCTCCEEQKKQEKHNTVLPIGKVASDGALQGFQWQGISYYLNDFVYGTPVNGTPVKDGLSELFQIMKINLMIEKREKASTNTELRLRVRILERADELFDHHGLMPCKAKDERQVLMSNEETTIFVGDLEGKYQVRHINHIDNLETYKEEPENFWVKSRVIFAGPHRSMVLNVEALDPKQIKYSPATDLELAEFISSKEKVLAHHVPRGLELFGGAGGLTLGLHNSGAVLTKDLVEISPAAAQTAENNLPWLVSHIEDVSSFLHRVSKFDGNQHRSDSDDADHTDICGKPVRNAPRPGEVYIIIAGFPCPAYSSANPKRRVDDIRNTLILATLSAIELYRPAYVLLENLGATQEDGKIQGGIEQGTLKFIYRALTLLGYQVEHDILQAGEYGTPQSRRRLIIWGALQGYELPKYPEATTTFRRTDSWHQTRESVPHRGYTVGDATSDLPPFDWINPHNVIPASDKENEERATRFKQGIEQLEVSQDQKYVGHDEQSYATPPLNDFQRKVRVGVTKVTNHVTPSWFDKPSWKEKGAISLARTEQVCNIAMRAGADHRSLPKKLTPWSLLHLRESSIERTRGQYGRLDSDKPFHCCTTIADPSQRDCRLIHSSQHRILSVREFARAQGFPDSYKWDIDTIGTKLAYRMIGNAVPIPLAEALGRELLKTLISQYERRSSMPLFQNTTSTYRSQLTGENSGLMKNKDNTAVDPIELD